VPHLIASTKASRTQALILNVGSLGGTIPSPYLAVYSASKAFLATFTNCLANELAPQNVVVRLVIPGFVVSKMSKIRTSNALVPTAKEWVKAALESIGVARGAQGRANESTPFWTHALLDYVVSKMGLLNIAVWYNGREYRAIERDRQSMAADERMIPGRRHASGHQEEGVAKEGQDAVKSSVDDRRGDDVSIVLVRTLDLRWVACLSMSAFIVVYHNLS
jgi:hypothetical protein